MMIRNRLLFILLICGIIFSFPALKSSTDHPNTVLFPDEYTELDDQDNTRPVLKDKFTKPILEKAQKDYYKAIELIAEGDTAKAGFMFEQAIARLNPLASYPNIEENSEYIELFQTIIDDYELFIRSTAFIDENTPFYIIQDLYFDDDDSIDIVVAGEEFFEPESIAFAPGYIPPTDSMIIDLPDNEYVQRNIDFYLKNKVGIKNLNRTLERSSKWFPMLKKYAKQTGVPEEVIYIAIIESALVPEAVSRASAVGMWQFMRSTGSMYSLNSPPCLWLDERRDPEKATKAAMQHLLDLYLVFGDWHLAFAAYNCGQGCVSRAIRRSGLPKEEIDFWKIMQYLPKETRYYVPRYVAVVKLFSNPSTYNIKLDSLNFQEEYKYDTFHLDSAVSLYGLAKCANISDDELKTLNPELIKSCTPIEGYDLKIPSGSKGLFALKYKELPAEDKTPFLTYKIQRRETVASVAKKFGISTAEIVMLNKLTNTKERLKEGDILFIPVDPRLWATAEALDDKRTAPTDSTKAYVTHKVEDGETLYGIAKKYNINPSVLQELNDFDPEEDVLIAGDELIIAQRNLTTEEVKSKSKEKKSNKNNPKIIQHKVKPGESLTAIANTYYVSVDDIQDENNLDNYKIYADQILKITTTEEYGQKKAEEKRQSAPRKNKSGDIVHTVRRGETLGGIANKYNTSAQKIRDLNPNDVDGDRIVAGATLQITGTVRASAQKAAKAETGSVPDGNYYIVKNGENFYTIAQKYGKTSDELMQLNPGVVPERIQIGQKIRVK